MSKPCVTCEGTVRGKWDAGYIITNEKSKINSLIGLRCPLRPLSSAGLYVSDSVLDYGQNLQPEKQSSTTAWYVLKLPTSYWKYWAFLQNLEFGGKDWQLPPFSGNSFCTFSCSTLVYIYIYGYGMSFKIIFNRCICSTMLHRIIMLAAVCM